MRASNVDLFLNPVALTIQTVKCGLSFACTPVQLREHWCVRILRRKRHQTFAANCRERSMTTTTRWYKFFILASLACAVEGRARTTGEVNTSTPSLSLTTSNARRQTASVRATLNNLSATVDARRWLSSSGVARRLEMPAQQSYR